MIKEGLQKIGRFFSRLIMPNVGIFIAWGFISSIFASTGWCPNERLQLLVDPLTKYLLPLSIAFTGGKLIGDTKGGTVAVIATIGVITGSENPMLVGAMLIGPLSGYIVKQFDSIIKGKIPKGFEMLVDNFSIAIIGTILAVLGLFVIGNLVSILIEFVNTFIVRITNTIALPLLAIFIEPMKVMFLNNAINHGVIDFIAIDQVNRTGKSILYLLEANPGPGLGVILAYCINGNGKMKESAPSAAIIEFLGGIHEIYYPYILVNPVLIIAPIIGSIVSIIIFQVFNTGLLAPASPGSILTVFLVSDKYSFIGNVLGILIGASVSFIIATILIRFMENKTDMNTVDYFNLNKEDVENVKKVVFVCDVGMGSSAMGASRFRSRIKEYNLNIQISNASISNIPNDADIVVIHKGLATEIRDKNKYRCIFIDNFIEDKQLDLLYTQLVGHRNVEVVSNYCSKSNNLLNDNNIVLGLESESKEDAIKRAGKVLLRNGHINENYIEFMLEREKKISTYIGMGIAIPHGTETGKQEVLSTGIVILQYPKGIDFNNNKTYLLIGIAAKENEHLEVLSSIANSLENRDLIDQIKTTDNVSEVLKAFNI